MLNEFMERDVGLSTRAAGQAASHALRQLGTTKGTGLRADRLVRNRLLAALSDETLDRLRPLLQRVELRRRQILHERNMPMRQAYFIERGAVSVLSRAGQKGSLEVGTLGRCDLVGISIVLGAGYSPHRCVVQAPGEALRIRSDLLAGLMEDLPCLRTLLLASVQAAMVESAQLAVCNARHDLKERLARWLLTAHDRLYGGEIPLTHQALSRAIGVRRAGVTTTIGQLEAAGILWRGRGRLTILDHAALERVSCECHRVIRSEHRRVVDPGSRAASLSPAPVQLMPRAA